ncbi:integrase [Vibrio parahaemolyticus]|uniref:site-specific recombinase phage integrase family domain protein n=1 Tax=Vibrio TaxID=662 RepID=UPI0002A554F0|nr:MULTISPECIES: site-specific recombinase phage integrase family domain protein [Vibrio]AGB11349.1 site-specific recombinase, phage integrase family domain protein [Vibrio parahaemolyticus BB22OP]MBE3700480.1 integrase [Vibrio parahaemolyticus]MBE3779427.1 integrase [Vibrio parahaemolyticus]MCZ6249416.1 integrase [Vibrio parahaemolyticus]MCZ6417137.1 integrase [Vibrio parahaemolyticus]
MLSVAIDNSSIANLIESIVLDHSLLNGLSAESLEDIINFSVANDDYRALDIITNFHTGIYSYDDRQPEWLESKFTAPKWTITFCKKPKTIHWDSVYLDDGKKLTDKKHQKLLNSFKYWITAADNPLENGGKIISPTTAYQKVIKVIALINAILLHSKELKLAKYHLLNVNDDFWLNILTKFAEHGNFQGVYEIDKRTQVLLDNASKSISDADAQTFKETFPYVTQDIAQDENFLLLAEREKACAWLFEQGYYHARNAIKYTGSGTVLGELLFKGKMLYHDINIPDYAELHLKAPKRNSEYRAVENRDASTGTSQPTISTYIEAIRLIHTNLKREDAASPSILSERVSSGHISQLVSLKRVGRTRTLPPTFVFNLIRQCYEFAKEHLPTEEGSTTLLDETLMLLSTARSKSAARYSNTLRPSEYTRAWNEELHREMSGSERGYWFQTEAINCLSSEYLKKGIKQVQGFADSVENRHERIRANESLFDLFSVLQGAIQVLVGAIMARRQDELIKLKPHGNISPNVSPFSKEGSKTEYNLIFKVKKTGSKGVNATIERPIPLSITRFVWQLEQFNIKASELNLCQGKLSLFNNLDSKRTQLSQVISRTYNAHLDNLCDYLETDLVEYDNGEYRRNYVRQHQLRRFFAMAFFWSKGFDGMDALRWMLGHSDMEHLYHYISESETGAVLNGAKASVIVRGVVDSISELAKLEGIEEVRKIIAERLTGDSSTPVTIESVSEAAEDYDDESYLTVPHISQLQKEQDIETEVIQLLDEGRITLEPEFFTIEDADGNTTQTFNLILKIKDLD